MRLILLSALVFVSSTSFAASSSSYSSSSSLKAVGLADTVNVTTGESLTGLFSMSGGDWLQTYFGMYQTKGAFSFAGGAAYKFTVAGNLHTGFHIGPGVTLGTVADDFAFAVFAACGGHFTFAEHFLISVDGGPMFTHTKDNNNFRIRGLGQLLGATVAYIF